LKAIHVAKTADLLGFEVPAPVANRAEIIEGVEIDYTSNELARALGGVLGGDGNFLERVLGRMTAVGSPTLEALRPIATRSLSRKFYRHYRGFALNQLGFLEKEPTVKKLLYVLRTTLTGVHLLEASELEADLTRLMDRYGVAEAAALIERKRGGERIGIDPAILESWRPRLDELFARLDRANETSSLPDAAPNEEEVREFLISARRARFDL
jgi:hypothetical protein